MVTIQLGKKKISQNLNEFLQGKCGLVCQFGIARSPRHRGIFTHNLSFNLFHEPPAGTHTEDKDRDHSREPGSHPSETHLLLMETGTDEDPFKQTPLSVELGRKSWAQDSAMMPDTGQLLLGERKKFSAT